MSFKLEEINYEKSFDSKQNIRKEFNENGDIMVDTCTLSNRLDREGDKLTPSPNALKEALPEFEKAGSPMLVSHGKNPNYQNRKVGYWFSHQITPKTFTIDTPELPYVKMQSQGIVQDSQAKIDVLSGIIKSASSRIKAISQLINPITGDCIITKLRFVEITICQEPMNPDCYFDSVKQTDNIANDFLYKAGQKVNAFGKQAYVKSMLVGSDNSKKYVLDFGDEYLKSVDVFETDLIDYYKSYITDFNDVSFENQLRNIIRQKVKDEGYYIPTQQLINWKYDFTFPVRFGKNLEFSTEINLDSSGKAKVLKKIKGAKINQTEIEKGIDSNTGLEQANYINKDIKKAVEKTKLDEVYKKYNETVNMSYKELKNWAENPKSKVASLDRTPIRRNLRLLQKKKEDWTQKDITDANRTISYVNRAKAIGKGKVTAKSEPFGRNEIALKNWAFKL